MFAATLTVSLATGLSDDLQLMDAHLTSGCCILALLVFRACWGFWGNNPNARFRAYRTSIDELRRYLRGRLGAPLHTPPGVLMAWSVWLACLVQASCGLLTSDDIFTEGPLARYASDEQIDVASFIHTRLFWVLIALATAHVAALAFYGIVRRDPLALGMFNGRKPLTTAISAPPGAAPLRGLACWLIAAAALAALLAL